MLLKRNKITVFLLLLLLFIFLLLSCSLEKMYSKYRYNLNYSKSKNKKTYIKINVDFLSEKYLKGVFSFEPSKNPFIVFDKNNKRQLTFRVFINNISENKYIYFNNNNVFIVFYNDNNKILFTLKPLGYKIIRDYYFVMKESYNFSDLGFMRFVKKLKDYFADERKVYKINPGAKFNKYITFVFKKFDLNRYDIKKIKFAVILKDDNFNHINYIFDIPLEYIVTQQKETDKEKEIEEVK